MFQVFTDLAANIPDELVASAGLGIIPIHCSVDGKLLDVAKDGFDGPAFYAAMRAGAKGIKCNCNGRLGGREIAGTEHYHEGTILPHG